LAARPPSIGLVADVKGLEEEGVVPVTEGEVLLTQSKPALGPVLAEEKE